VEEAGIKPPHGWDVGLFLFDRFILG